MYLPEFYRLKQIVKRHFAQTFSYWDSANKVSNGYTECVNGLIKLANRLGRGYSFEMIRARALYGHKDSDKPKKGRQEKITDQED
ncbi:transposase [Moraxella caviae]|nr:transposase [Moraxella caviae]